MNFKYELVEILVEKNLKEGAVTLVFNDFCNGIDHGYAGKIVIFLDDKTYEICPDENSSESLRVEFIEQIQKDYVRKFSFKPITDVFGKTNINISRTLEKIAQRKNLKPTSLDEKELLEDYLLDLEEYHLGLKLENEMF